MSVVRFVAAACLLLITRPLFAEEWVRYENLEDRFAVSAPGQPATEKIKWKSEYDSIFPATVYRWQEGPNHYAATVVDYSDSEAIYTANHHSQDLQLQVYWQIDILGSVQYAATQYRQKPGVKVTFDAFHYINLVTGHELQLTNPDQSRTYVGIYLHENRLYIFDATVAKGMPPPLIFQQSPEFWTHRERRFAIGPTTSTGCRNSASPDAAGAAPAVLLEQVRKARLLEVADRSSAEHRHSSSGTVERTSERPCVPLRAEISYRSSRAHHGKRIYSNRRARWSVVHCIQSRDSWRKWPR